MPHRLGVCCLCNCPDRCLRTLQVGITAVEPEALLAAHEDMLMLDLHNCYT